MRDIKGAREREREAPERLSWWERPAGVATLILGVFVVVAAAVVVLAVAPWRSASTTSETSSAPAATTTPLGCAPDPGAWDWPASSCTFRALASRLCSMNLEAAPVLAGISVRQARWNGPALFAVSDLYGPGVAPSGMVTFNCTNNTTHQYHGLKFTTAEWQALTSPGPMTGAVDAMLRGQGQMRTQG